MAIWCFISSFCRSVSTKNSYGRSLFSTISSSSVSYHLTNGPSYMRAAVFWEANKSLTIEDFHMPRPKLGEVLIKTRACGVCHSDLHVMKGELPFPTPCVLGHEITGEVVEHGPFTDNQVIQRFPVGAHVVGAFIMPCGSCFFCTKGEDDLCKSFFAYNRAKGTLYDGETRLFLRNSGKPVFMYSMGGFSEYCVIPVNALCLLPPSLPYTESAILGCAAFTAYGAMAHAAEVRPGDSVAIIGIGGVGSSCVQLARAFGASDIIGVDLHEEKLQKALLLGASHVVNAGEEDVLQKIWELSGGMGVDIAVEALGRPHTFSRCVESVRDGGKAIIIGLARAGEVGEVDINRLVRRKIKVIGSYGGRARHDLSRLVKLVQSGNLNLTSTVTRKCALEEVGEVYRDLDQGKIVGRAVIEISD